MLKTGFVVAAVLGLAVTGCGGGGVVSTPATESRFDGATFPAGVRAHDFALDDQQGRRISLSAYRGQVVALAFLSTDCRACVLVAQQVRGALDELGASSVKTIFVTTSPRADTAASVRRFLNETSLTGRVLYLTGTSAQLRPVWLAYRVAPASAGKRAAEAATTVLLIDRDGIERVGFGVEQITPEALTHDIHELRAG